MGGMKKVDLKTISWKYGAVIFFFILFFYNCAVTRNFVRFITIQNMFIQSFPIVLISFGMTLVIATGNIDISCGSGMALAAVLFAFAVRSGIHPFLAVCLVMVVGASFGWFCGVLVARFQVQSMIITMAMLYMLRGIAKGISGGALVSYKNDELSALSYYKIGGVIPIHLAIILIVFLIMYFVVEKTRYGTYLEASGDNAKAAEIAGVNVSGILISVYVISGVLAAFSGAQQCVMVSLADSSNVGLTREFDAIAATVVGGTPMSGGKPNLVGTLFAALLLQLINMMVNMNNIHFALAYVIKAFLIIGAVLIQTYTAKK